MSKNAEKIVKQSKNPELIGRVIEFAKITYGDKRRSTGELFVDHVTNVALLLSDMGLDDITVAGGILHDAANPSVASAKAEVLASIEKEFGLEICGLVEKNTELNKIYHSLRANEPAAFVQKTERTENLRKMFLAVAKDLRVVLIELAARIDGLQNIKKLPVEKQKLYATETLDIFVPIANRLGLGEIKRSLEDPAFAVLLPEKFAWLQENLKEKYEERQKYLKHFIPKLKKILQHEHISALDLHYRPKSYWSSWQKLERHNGNFEKLHDLVAIRLVVKDISTCYKALGIIHKHFTPMSGHIQDYIAKPKENGYQSLHTTVNLEPGVLSEIQIKTAEMHQEAMFGVCAHWAYKEKIDLQKSKVPVIDFFENQIFAFTPKGDVISLPKGSTAVDFAYAVHSDVGNHCEGAKVAGHIIPLSQALQNGDVVEIITNKKRKPSYDWLQFVKTGLAKSNIRKVTSVIISPIFSVPSYLKKKIFGEGKKLVEARPPQMRPPQILLAGQSGIKATMAKCCNPTHKHEVKAYLTKYRAAVVHQVSCKNFQKLAKIFPEKVMEATWHAS